MPRWYLRRLLIMANKPVTGFNEVTSLEDDDWAHIVRNNVDKKIKGSNLKQSTGSGGKLIIEFDGAWPGNQTLPDTRNLIYILNASNSTVKTIYFNLNPQKGDEVTVVDKKGDTTTYNVTLNGNGKQIQGNTDALMNSNGMSLSWLFDGGAWILI